MDVWAYAECIDDFYPEETCPAAQKSLIRLIGTLDGRPRTEHYFYSLYHTTHANCSAESKENECLQDFPV